MMPEGREKKGFSALNSSDWIVISSFGAYKTNRILYTLGG